MTPPTSSLPTTSPGGVPAPTPVFPLLQLGPTVRNTSAVLNPGETSWFAAGAGVTLTLPQPPNFPKNTIFNNNASVSVTVAAANGELLISLAGAIGPIVVAPGQAITVQRCTNGTGVTGWVEIDTTGSGGGGGATPATLRTVTAATTIVSGDAGNVVEIDATGGAIGQPLPDATTYTGRFTLVATTTGANLVTLTTTGGQRIIVPGSAAASTLTLGTPAGGGTFQSVDLIPDGANWRVV